MKRKMLSLESDPRFTPEVFQEAMARLETAFDKLPETDQILTRCATKVHISYSVYDPTGKAREDTARAFLTKEFGPKFAERVLESTDYRKILAVDDPPIRPGGATTIVAVL